MPKLEFKTMKSNDSLFGIAKEYVGIIESMERTDDKEGLARLEEERAVWHGRLIDKLKKEGIQFKDRDHVTAIAFRIARQEL